MPMKTIATSLDSQTSLHLKRCATRPKAKSRRAAEGVEAPFSQDVEAKFQRLCELDATGRTASWQAARIAYELYYEDGIQQQTITERLGKVKGTVSSYIKAVSAEIEAERDGFGPIDGIMGTDAAARTYREWLNLGPLDAKRVGFARFIRIRLKVKSGRQARRTITGELLHEYAAELAERANATLSRLSLSDRCVPGDCAKWLEAQDAGSIRLLHCDPPYGDYIKDKDGKLFADHSELAGLRTDCANETSKMALRTTCEMLAQSERVLAPDEGDGRGGGALLLWQAAGTVVRREIVDAVDAAGLEIRWELFVHTGAPKLGHAKAPHSRNAEKLLVIQRRGDSLMRCDGGEELAHSGCVILFEDIRKQVQRWQNARKRAFFSFADGEPMVPTVPKEFRHRKIRSDSTIRNGDGHFMMKHEEVSLFLLTKYCMPGERVADLYGCSASFCIAAEQFGADWTYIELDKKNFAFGVDRIRSMKVALAAHE